AERLRSPSIYSPSPLEGEGGAKRRKGGAGAKLQGLLSRAAGPLSEVDSKSLLKTYGLATPKEHVAKTEREAIAAAKRIDFPVVMKAVAPALAHKSDIGAVVLGLETAAGVRNAYKKIVAATKRARVLLDGVLIAEQLSDGLELVLGANRDPEMGPVILFG